MLFLCFDVANGVYIYLKLLDWSQHIVHLINTDIIIVSETVP